MNSYLAFGCRLRLLMVAAAVFAVGVAAAAPPANYYQTVTTQTGAELKEELYLIVSGQRGYAFKSLTYAATRDVLLNSVDSVGENQVKMIYTNDIRTTDGWPATINREHSWPQSYGSSVRPKDADLHHLFLCDASINSSRQNMLYGYVTGGVIETNYTGLPEDQNIRTSTVWQASPRSRGDVARAILYMDTRYTDYSLINRGETLGSNQMGYLDDILQWNAEDPVDDWDRGRNDRVFTFQNNRNPYIDHPEWITLVYGAANNAAPSIANTVTIPAVPVEGQAIGFSTAATDGDGVASVQAFWRVGGAGTFTATPMANAGGSTFTAPNAVSMQPEGTIVDYYVRAEDAVGNVSFRPVSADVSPLTVVVRGDSPELTAMEILPGTIRASDRPNIFVTARDNAGDGADNLTLKVFWRLAGNGPFAEVPMAIVSGTRWETTVSLPEQPEDTAVQYYVEARDAGGKTATLPAGGPADPSAYFVEADYPFLAIPNADAVAGRILLTEFAHQTVDAFTEFVEIANVSSEDYRIGGLVITDNNVGAVSESWVLFPPEARLPRGGIVVAFIRAAPSQEFLDAIPRVSNRDGAPVQVYVLDGERTFDGRPAPSLLRGDAGEPNLSTADNLSLVFWATGVTPTEAHTSAQVIDGVGWGNITTANKTVGWGPNITTDTSEFNVTIGSRDGAVRIVPGDTNTKADWMSYTGADQYTPGALPDAFKDRVGEAWVLF